MLNKSQNILTEYSSKNSTDLRTRIFEENATSNHINKYPKVHISITWPLQSQEGGKKESLDDFKLTYDITESFNGKTSTKTPRKQDEFMYPQE